MSGFNQFYNPIARLSLLACLGCGVGFSFQASALELGPDFKALVEEETGDGSVRTQDELILKENTTTINKGEIIATDDPNVIIFKTRSSRTPYKAEDIRKIYLRRTPETILDGIFSKNSGNIRILVEKLRDFGITTRGFEDKIMSRMETLAGAKPDNDLFLFMAELYMVQGKADKAEASARKVVEKDPRSAMGWCYLGMAQAKTGQADEAAKSIAKASELDPGNEKIQVARSSVLNASGRSEDAKAGFEEVLKKNPQQVSAWLGLGKLLLQEGEIEAAGQKFEQALKLDPKSLQGMVGLSACKSLSKDFDAAYKIADGVFMIDTRNENVIPKVNELQAYARMMAPAEDYNVLSANLDKAREKIGLAIKEDLTDPRFKLIHYRLAERSAEVSERLGKANDVVAFKDEAARIQADLEAMDPAKLTDNAVVFWIAERLYRRGEYEKALPLVRRLTVLTPNYAQAHQTLGATLLKLRKWDEAAAAFDKASSIDSALADARAGSGLALLGKKDLPGAKERLKKALELDSVNVPALCGMGYIANFESNELGARALFQQAIAVDGHCAYAADALKKMYEQRELLFQYVDFNNSTAASGGWMVKGSGLLKPQVANGRLEWKGSGTGAVNMQKQEYFLPIQAEGFKRVEADLRVAPNSGASLALRVASRTGSAVTFELEYGKDPNGNVGYRLRDYAGVAMEWKPLPKPMPWPDSGKARLAIESSDLTRGDITLYFNGKNVGKMTLQLKNPTRITAGLALQAPSNENIDASADNVALLYKRGTDKGGVAPGGTELKAPDEKPEEPAGGK